MELILLYAWDKIHAKVRNNGLGYRYTVCLLHSTISKLNTSYIKINLCITCRFDVAKINRRLLCSKQ